MIHPSQLVDYVKGEYERLQELYQSVQNPFLLTKLVYARHIYDTLSQMVEKDIEEERERLCKLECGK